MRNFSGTLPNYVLWASSGIHMLLGFPLLVLSCVQFGLLDSEIHDFWNPGISNNRTRYELYAHYPVVAVCFSSILMIVTGILAASAPLLNNPIRTAAVVSGYKVMTFFVAVIFSPLSFAICFTFAHLFNVDRDAGAMGATMATFAALEMMTSVITCFVICCYSPYSLPQSPDFRFRPEYHPEVTMGRNFKPLSAHSADRPIRQTPHWIRHF